MQEQGYRSHGAGRIKIFAGVLTLGFVITLAIIVGNRLSDESLAVLAGAVCGVGAAIPTSLLILAVSRRRDDARPASPASVSSGYPPVVVVTAPNAQQQPGGWNGLPASVAPLPLERHFTVVGSPGIEQEASRNERYYGG